MPSRIDEPGHTMVFIYPVMDHWRERQSVQVSYRNLTLWKTDPGVSFLYRNLGPVSLRQYELVYSIFARKQEFLVYFQALSHRNLRGI